LFDKLEVQVPAPTPFSPAIGQVYGDPKIFRRSKNYLSVGDLTRIGYPAMVHMHCVWGKGGHHKVELLNTGEMSFSRMRAWIERIFKVDSRKLKVMRVDLTADVRGVPVRWFVNNARVRWKRKVCDIGQIECKRFGQYRIETFYLGKRPNVFRIYDKIAEWRVQYARLLRRTSDAAELPTFEEAYGCPDVGITLTRVERQIGGSRVPTQIDTVAKLKCAAAFNPFVNMEFLAGVQAEPRLEEEGIQRFAVGELIRHMVKEDGFQRTRALLNKVSGGHAQRFFKDYADYLPAEAGITGKRLFEVYQASVTRQLRS
jgi:hypothetical protein